MLILTKILLEKCRNMTKIEEENFSIFTTSMLLKMMKFNALIFDFSVQFPVHEYRDYSAQDAVYRCTTRRLNNYQNHFLVL